MTNSDGGETEGSEDEPRRTRSDTGDELATEEDDSPDGTGGDEDSLDG